ncbi:hypothetical protein AFL94_08950 [Arthrobacter sp. LS16]|nr:hypothetical protein AFL94_08950 [Arthrobacter sp. LS16]
MSVYKFDCDIQKNEIELYFEGEAIAVDMQPTDENLMWGQLRPIERPGFEVIMPVAEVENLITNLQTMVKTIRERFPDAA